MTSGRFPSIGLGNGMATLDFTSAKQAGNRILDFKFDLKGADQSAFLSAISRAEAFSPETRKLIGDYAASDSDSSGKIDLRIQAKGPFESFLQFTGTGHVRLIEKGLQKVNLLGGISERLDAIKLPLPSGSFSFETLEIPFRLESDQVYSRQHSSHGTFVQTRSYGTPEPRFRRNWRYLEAQAHWQPEDTDRKQYHKLGGPPAENH